MYLNIIFVNEELLNGLMSELFTSSIKKFT